MVGGVPPLGQVDLGQDAGLAGHPGVDLVVWQDHGVDLDVVDVVRAVAQHPRQLGLPDLGQLKCVVQRGIITRGRGVMRDYT